MQNLPGIDAVADVSQLRTVLYQSGTLVHGPYGMGMQPVDADLTAIAALSGTGIATRTGSGTWATRTIVGPAAGLTITNGNGVSGNPTLALANDLAALEALSGAGIPARTGTDTWAARTIVAPSSGLTVSNGNGAAGNPTFALANDLAAVEGLSGTGIPRRTGTDTWSLISYETGSWTPTLFGITTPGTYTYAVQSGSYIRIGNFVLVEFYVLTNGVTSAGSGTTLIGTLPFAMAAGTNQLGGSLGTVTGIAALPAGFSAWSLRAGPSGTSITVVYTNSTNGANAGADIATIVGSNTQFRGSFAYIT